MNGEERPDHSSWLENLSLTLGAAILCVQLWYVINEATHGELTNAAKRWWHYVGVKHWENIKFLLCTEEVMVQLIEHEITPFLGRQ